MVLHGLIGGITQVCYVVFLLYLLLYIYAIAGIIFFSDNDPWNFNNIETTMLILLRVVSLDTWGENFYTNYYGCSDYPGGMTPTYTDVASLAIGKPGGVKYCSTPKSRPLLTTMYYLSFICLGSFGILSSIIGLSSFLSLLILFLFLSIVVI